MSDVHLDGWVDADRAAEVSHGMTSGKMRSLEGGDTRWLNLRVITGRGNLNMMFHEGAAWLSAWYPRAKLEGR